MKTFQQYLNEIHSDSDYVLGGYEDQEDNELQRVITKVKQDIQTLDDQHIKEFINNSFRIYGGRSKVFFLNPESLYLTNEKNPTNINFFKSNKEYTISLKKSTYAYGYATLTKILLPWTYDHQLKDSEPESSPHNSSVYKEAKDYITNAIIQFVNDIKYNSDKLKWKE